MTTQITKTFSVPKTSSSAPKEAIGNTAPPQSRWSAQKHVRLPYKPGLPLSSGGGGDGGE
jgi:hypothetical protein